MKMFTLLPIAVFRQQPIIGNTQYILPAPQRAAYTGEKKLSGTHVPIVFHIHFYFEILDLVC